MSAFHFLRVFKQITSVTPHQYVLRARLRQAAIRLKSTREPVLSIALDCGFRDLSNFNHAFRAEFGANPTRFRA
jgi:AraC family transcriptional regulator